jgi:hypothetical protein
MLCDKQWSEADPPSWRTRVECSGAMALMQQVKHQKPERLARAVLAPERPRQA